MDTQKIRLSKDIIYGEIRRVRAMTPDQREHYCKNTLQELPTHLRARVDANLSDLLMDLGEDRKFHVDMQLDYCDSKNENIQIIRVALIGCLERMADSGVPAS